MRIADSFESCLLRVDLLWHSSPMFFFLNLTPMGVGQCSLTPLSKHRMKQLWKNGISRVAVNNPQFTITIIYQIYQTVLAPFPVKPYYLSQKLSLIGCSLQTLGLNNWWVELLCWQPELCAWDDIYLGKQRTASINKILVLQVHFPLYNLIITFLQFNIVFECCNKKKICSFPELFKLSNCDASTDP